MSKLDDLLAVDSPSALNRIEQQDLFDHLRLEEKSLERFPEYWVSVLRVTCQCCEHSIDTYLDIRQRCVSHRNTGSSLHRMEPCSLPEFSSVQKVEFHYTRREVPYCDICLNKWVGNIPEPIERKIHMPLQKESRKV